MNRSLNLNRPYGTEFPTDPAGRRDEDTLAEILLAGRRQAGVVAICAFVGLVLGLVHYMTSPKFYQSAATVMVEERQTDLVQEIAAATPDARSDTSMLNQMQVLGSLELASQVVRSLDLADNQDFLSPPSSLLSNLFSDARSAVRSLLPRPPDQGTGTTATPEQIEERRVLRAAQLLRNRTDFRRVGRSFVVEIWYESHNAALATEIVNAYAEAYLADGTQANVEASSRMSEWLQARLAELSAAANAAAEEAERFRVEHGASDQQGLRERVQRAEALNNLVVRFQSRYEEIALEGSFPVSTGRILSQALVPRDPAKPKGWQMLAGGLVLGIMAGLGIAVLRELRETGFRTDGDVTSVLGLPLLGYLPEIRRRELHRGDPNGLSRAAANDRVRFASPRPAGDDATTLPDLMARHAAPPLTLGTPDGRPRPPRNLMVSTYAPGSESDRALRNILADLDLDLDDGTCRVVAVCGAVAGEGATHLAANLANASARAGMKTLLLDGDFARFDLTRRLGTEGAAGTIDVLDGLVGLGQAVIHMPGSGADFLPTGARADVPTDPSYLAEIGELIAVLRQSYDYIFIDLPPLGRDPDAKLLRRSIDRMILVARWGVTRRKLLHHCLEREPELRRRVLGVVLNATDLRRLKRYGVPGFGPEGRPA